MKTIGLIGGTTWLSTVDYYRIINETANKILGGLNSAELLLYSLNFADKKKNLDTNNWKAIAEKYCEVALNLQNAGAECIVLCANTPHTIADDVQKAIRIPLIHIAEATAQEIAQKQLNKVGLLGTKFTMEGDFFKEKLCSKGIEILIPDTIDRAFINDSIFNELGKNIFSAETKERYLSIINKLIEQGAEGIIFGCTEIPLLIKPEECAVPVFDTTLIHAKAAVKFSLDM
ncbi:MAG: racX [Segetibacter sp.]|nr:racX [Segetibacter sp.]